VETLELSKIKPLRRLRQRRGVWNFTWYHLYQ